MSVCVTNTFAGSIAKPSLSRRKLEISPNVDRSIPERTNELDASKSYIVVCKGGVRSANACEYLASQGFDVTNLEGGMMAYDGELEFK